MPKVPEFCQTMWCGGGLLNSDDDDRAAAERRHVARGWWQLKLGRRKDGSLSGRYLHFFCGRLDIKASGPPSQIQQKKITMCVL